MDELITSGVLDPALGDTFAGSPIDVIHEQLLKDQDSMPKITASEIEEMQKKANITFPSPSTDDHDPAWVPPIIKGPEL